jgi:branched-chain amino acid transport system ATP-binding protein
LAHSGTLKLTVAGVTAGYGAVRALEGVSLNVAQGETVVLLGTNGNGKSTLMKCLTGLVRPTAGRITLETETGTHDLTKLPTEEIVGLGIALVPEGRRLFAKLTVEENLMLGAYRREARAGIARNLAFAYEAFPILAERRTQLAGTMSGGQQQMLAIGRAMMSSPKLLLVDEPSVGLSPLLVQQTITKIGELREKFGLTVLMAEQNFQQAVRIADRGYIIVHGAIAYEGKSVEDLKTNPLVKQLYLGGVA